MADGRFITLEGGEGVGKTTNLQFVVDRLKQHGLDVVVTREPGGTPVAEELRDLLLRVRDDEMVPLAELLLMFAGRAQHVEQLVKPALAKGQWVVCDRFTDATYAYQGGGRGIDDRQIALLEEMVQGPLRPDLTIYLDVPVQIAAERIAGREHDRIERERVEFFESVRATYIARAREYSRIQLVDAAADIEQVQADIALILDYFVGSAD
ncbi:MAG: dTMP kinase [Gammaproteobacteria bacterium]|nr:dTMP kinase [Gammaproteobacteria bacterium]|tara:strand:- start:3395 stop:4021 length:627 start_codon:yes stop_codon:yes gene_type:complete